MIVTILAWIIAIMLVASFIGKRIRKVRAGLGYVKARYEEEFSNR